MLGKELERKCISSSMMVGEYYMILFKLNELIFYINILYYFNCRNIIKNNNRNNLYWIGVYTYIVELIIIIYQLIITYTVYI